MGTNYYVKTTTLCPTCGKEGYDNLIHLGKNSMGWKFHLQLNGKKYYNSFPEMIEWIKSNNLVIVNEYEETVSLEEFVDLVESLKNEDESENWAKSKYKDNSIYIDGYKFSDHEFC